MLDFFKMIFNRCVETLFLCFWLKSSKTTLRFRLSQLEDAVTRINTQAIDTDVYFGVGLQSEDHGLSKRGTITDICAISAFWFDLDIAGEGHASPQYPTNIKQAMEFIEEFPLQPSAIVNSGGGLHIYWLLELPWVFNNVDDRNRAQEMSMAHQVSIIKKGRKHGWKLDNTSDLTRILRPPGTFNHKTSVPRTVEIVYLKDRRYALDDFKTMMLVSEPEVPIQLVQKAPVDIEYPPADADQLIHHCAWMRHCKEDAAILSEPSWYRMLSILVRCADGNKLAHEWSSSYPNYSFQETEQKLSQALNNAGPATCKHIFEVLDGQGYCDACPFFSYISSPIQLGQNDDLMQAKFAVIASVKDYVTNPGKIFVEENLKALALIGKRDVAVYNTIRQGFIKAGIPVRKIEQMMLTAGATDEQNKYEERNGRLFYLKPTQYGEKAVPLCNFSARICEELVIDDGAESRIVFKILAKNANGEALPDISVSAAEFSSMNWITANYGTKAIIEAGQTSKEHLRVAIMALSTDVKRTVAFAHTGWRKVDGQWIYLTGSGAITKDGFDGSIAVDLSSSLAAYNLQTPSHSLMEAFKATLRMLVLAPLKITILLFCAIFRAPLAELAPIDFTVFIAGRSGSFKSEIAALMQAHWGAAFNRLNLPGNWTSTANMLEKLAFWLKDVVFVIDDFLPAHSHLATNELHQKAERLIRGQGNQSGRGRMNADGSLRTTYSPRGVMVMTGEDTPRGFSLNARMLVAEVRTEDINIQVLSELQTCAASGLFAATMFYFVQWMAPQVEDLEVYLKKRKVELRDEALNIVKSHARTPDLVASLMLGLECFLAFGIDAKVISKQEAMKLREQGWDVLIAADTGQQEMQFENDPAERFLSLLKAAFMSGSAHLESVAGGEPTNSDLWGWRETETQQGGVTSYASKPLGNMIGWTDGTYIYMNPDSVWQVVQTLANRQNNPLTTTPITMRKRLAERKLIIVKDGKNTVQKSIKGVKHRVIQMPVSALYEFSQPQPVPQITPTAVPRPAPATSPQIEREPEYPPTSVDSLQPLTADAVESFGAFPDDAPQPAVVQISVDIFAEPFVELEPFIPDEPQK